jgi:adenosine kinase
MCTHLGAANHYRIDHLRQAGIWQMVEAALVYFVGGYHLTVCPEAVMALAEEAAAKNKAIGQPVFSPMGPIDIVC